jgi:hypothetical protein
MRKKKDEQGDEGDQEFLLFNGAYSPTPGHGDGMMGGARERMARLQKAGYGAVLPDARHLFRQGKKETL